MVAILSEKKTALVFMCVVAGRLWKLAEGSQAPVLCAVTIALF